MIPKEQKPLRKQMHKPPQINLNQNAVQDLRNLRGNFFAEISNIPFRQCDYSLGGDSIVNFNWWRPRYLIDYSPYGDSIDEFSLKVRAEVMLVYHLLHRLRTLDAGADACADTVPYQLRVDTENELLLIRDAKNENWIELGSLSEKLGITPEDIEAIKSLGTIGAFGGGSVADLPMEAEENDIFYAFDEQKIYSYTGTEWEIISSMDANDLHNCENLFVMRDEVDYNGAGKVLRLDETTGKANVDITGSPEKILNYPIEVTELKNSDVLAFDAANGKIINMPKDDITSGDVSSTGELNKIVRLDSEGVVHADIDGKFATARRFSIVGDATGDCSFDGSEDVTINLDVLKAKIALSAVKDSDGNIISETYATKAGLSIFVTSDELRTILGENNEEISREEIAALFKGSD